jgi:hypothetical protein
MTQILARTHSHTHIDTQIDGRETFSVRPVRVTSVCQAMAPSCYQDTLGFRGTGTLDPTGRKAQLGILKPSKPCLLWVTSILLCCRQTAHTHTTLSQLSLLHSPLTQESLRFCTLDSQHPSQAAGRGATAQQRYQGAKPAHNRCMMATVLRME